MQERVPALVFSVRGSQYGLLQDGGAALLPWMQRFSPPGPVPGAPAWIVGLLNVQGTVQAIVDLGAFLGLGAATPDDAARLVFVERDDIRVGLLVDTASGIRYLDSVDYSAVDAGALLVAGTAAVNGQSIRVLDGSALIDALVRSLATPGHSGAAGGA